MLKESIRDLVLSIAEGDTLAIEDSFNSVMASKISDRLDSMRVDVAQGMFGSVDESYDSSDAYETWDPKHPKFKDKLIKHHAKGGTTQSFIDQEKAKAKKKLTREEVELEELTLEDYSVEELEDFMMSEDFEQLDELSKATLGSYVKKASGKLASHGTNLMGSVGNFNIKNAEYHGTKIDKRQKGISKAVDKLTKEEFTLGDYSLEELEDFMVSEDFEQLDELSKKTLGSYVKKATTNAIISGEALGKGEKWSKSGQIASKREKGIGKAVGKLTQD